jgi:hypothetical protein
MPGDPELERRERRHLRMVALGGLPPPAEGIGGTSLP